MKDMLRSEIPMQIAFDVVRMKRGDPEEEIFEKILLAVSSAPEEKLAGEPVAFPIFGRGRTVDGIPGKEMTEELMGYACSYICGACSCEVKRDNPGADILMTADWDEALEGNWVVVDKELPPLAGVGDLIEAKTAPPETPSADTPQPANPQATGAAKSTLPKNLIWLGCGLLAVLVIATILVKRGTRR